MYNIYIAITTLKIHTIIYIYIFTNKLYKVYKQQNNSADTVLQSKNLTRNQHSEV